MATKDKFSVTVEFAYSRSTKGTHRFDEVADPGKEVVGSLYIKKSAMPTEVQKLTVTIKEA